MRRVGRRLPLIHSGLTEGDGNCSFQMYIREAAMVQVNVTALRQCLPEYLAMVARGETLSVTLRGRVIAEISPPVVAADESVAARARLRDSLLRYDLPFEPAMAVGEWAMNR